jgi:hypothetical protein
MSTLNLNQVLVALPVILAIWEAENRRIKIQDQPEQVVQETTSPK